MVDGLATINARTKLGLWALIRSDENRANDPSCKHFCCREGLDKPPKHPKRTIPPVPKKSGLNQLTISSSMIKDSSASRSHPGNEETRRQTTKPKGDDPFVKVKRGSTSQTAKKTLSQSRPALSEKDKNTLPQKRKREASLKKDLSSDYGDEDFDLLSPSRLLGNKEPESKRPVSSLMSAKTPEEIRQNPHGERNCADDLEASVSRPKPSRRSQSKLSTPKPQATTIVIADDTPPESHKFPITDHKESSNKQSKLFLPPGINETPVPKRKASPDEPPKQSQQKRVKRSFSASVSPLQVSSHSSQEEPLNAELPVSSAIAGMDLTAAWHDDGIDLLDEFKDIITFI